MEKKLGIGDIILKILGITISVLMVVLVAYALYRGGQYAYDFGYRVFTETPMTSIEESEDKVVQITADMGAKEIGELLEKKGLVRDAELFLIQLKLSAYAKEIKEGTYTLSTSMTAREMMQVMSAEDVESTEMEE
ncbi:MAG: endolytic transglycosylase MltG [Lachnospiraceae bacterium]|nr:endolytic transglycosylase MltG [Lachnospiraceae bacterium]